MSASTAFVGKGTVLARGDGAGPEVFTAVAEVRRIDGFEHLRALADATHLSSDNEYRERKPAMKDLSPLTMEVNFLPGTAGQMFDTGIGDDYEDGTLRNWKVTFPDAGAATLLFAAYVTKYRVNGVDPDNVVTATIELSPQGKPTWTP
jgi:hypothetical protein